MSSMQSSGKATVSCERVLFVYKLYANVIQRWDDFTYAGYWMVFHKYCKGKVCWTFPFKEEDHALKDQARSPRNQTYNMAFSNFYFFLFFCTQV